MKPRSKAKFCRHALIAISVGCIYAVGIPALSNEKAEQEIQKLLEKQNFAQAKEIASSGLNKADTYDRAEYNYLLSKVLMWEFWTAQDKRLRADIGPVMAHLSRNDGTDAYATGGPVKQPIPADSPLDVFAGDRLTAAHDRPATSAKIAMVDVEEPSTKQIPPVQKTRQKINVKYRRIELLDEALAHIKLAANLRPKDEIYGPLAESMENFKSQLPKH